MPRWPSHADGGRMTDGPTVWNRHRRNRCPTPAAATHVTDAHGAPVRLLPRLSCESGTAECFGRLPRCRGRGRRATCSSGNLCPVDDDRADHGFSDMLSGSVVRQDLQGPIPGPGAGVDHLKVTARDFDEFGAIACGCCGGDEALAVGKRDFFVAARVHCDGREAKWHSQHRVGQPVSVGHLVGRAAHEVNGWLTRGRTLGCGAQIQHAGERDRTRRLNFGRCTGRTGRERGSTCGPNRELATCGVTHTDH